LKTICPVPDEISVEVVNEKVAVPVGVSVALLRVKAEDATAVMAPTAGTST